MSLLGENKRELFGNFSVITNKQKGAIWQRMAKQLAATTNTVRTVPQLKKKKKLFSTSFHNNVNDMIGILYGFFSP